MHGRNLLEFSPHFKQSIYGFISLLGSGVISTIGFVLLTSRRWPIMEVSVSNFLVLFVQLQIFGLTVAKLGSEQVIFAIISKDNFVYVNPTKLITKFVLPISLGFSFIIGYYFSLIAAFVGCSSILLDAYSILIMADLNGRREFKAVSWANLLNYPLFFVFVFLSSTWITLTNNIVLMMFFLASLLRFLWLYRFSSRYNDLPNISYKPSINIALQQIFNYFLFRSDQIALVTLGYLKINVDNVAMYLFLSKFPEIVSGIMVSLGTVVFPYKYITYPVDINTFFILVRRNMWLVLLYVFLGMIAIFSYSRLYVGGEIDKRFLVPFLMHSIFIIVINCISYSMLRQGYIAGLVKNLFIASIVGAAMFIYVSSRINLYYMAWIVPIQMIVFVAISITLSWGSYRAIHE